MLETTPQERMALIVLAVLLTAGAVGRHALFRADLGGGLQYSAEGADTLNASSSLRKRVEQEVERANAGRVPLAAGERIDPNRATAEELERLPRIGPALAERIVTHRRTVGPFRTTADLQSVAGIGESLLDGIAPHLDLSRAPAAPGRSSAGRQGVDFNRASADELQTVPGIGPVIAERIVRFRQENGRFRTFADLENVAGVGPRLRERLERVGRLGP